MESKNAARTVTAAKQATGKKNKKASGKSTAPKLSPNGQITPIRDAALSPTWAQQGDAITTGQGVRVSDTDNTLRAGPRGPALLEDFHMREKIMHFDHERIPERVVHARGAGAHGIFELYESLDDLTMARFLCDRTQSTPVFVRFSTVAGSRGSADTARDVRGFAVKFYTQDGNFDLVGNNMPVFFIQDGIKFPDVIHAVKPEPDREIPQAASAHDTFWDFASLTPETTHMLMWVMSDRAIPRSFAMMEGFGVHTFRLVSREGATTLVKFHWKPLAGMHSLVWEESQKLGGVDPDFHRRSLWNSIEAGVFPQWEFGVQVLPDSDDQFFEGIDLLDPTKIVPEELAPVRKVGRLTLNRNPSNFFAETEQVAFHIGHLVPGIDVTYDPPLHARLFSYLDTQLTRLGGPNFAQIPINRPHAMVNDNLRDGFGQQAIHEGRTPYAPNSLGGGCPFASLDNGAFVHVPRQVQGVKVRERAQSFSDHFSQATLFWNSISAHERDHLVDAFSFELGKVESTQVVARMLATLADVKAELCERVAHNLGQSAPVGQPASDAGSSSALSMAATSSGPIAGRVVGVIAADGLDTRGLAALKAAVTKRDAVLQVVAPRGGTLGRGVAVQKSLLTTQSVEFDGLVVAGGSGVAELATDPRVQVMLQEAFRHNKTIAAWGEGEGLLESASIPLDAAGVVTAESANGDFATRFCDALGWHRHWDRSPAAPNPGDGSPRRNVGRRNGEPRKARR